MCLCFQHFIAFRLNYGKIYIGSNGKESARNPGDLGWIPGSGKSPGEGKDYPPHCSCLENPMDRGAWGGPPQDCKESDTTERLTKKKRNAYHRMVLTISQCIAQWCEVCSNCYAPITTIHLWNTFIFQTETPHPLNINASFLPFSSPTLHQPLESTI